MQWSDWFIRRPVGPTCAQHTMQKISYFCPNQQVNQQTSISIKKKEKDLKSNVKQSVSLNKSRDDKLTVPKSQ